MGMHLVFLPGIDGTGWLFEPLVALLPKEVKRTIISYPPDQTMTLTELETYIDHRLPQEPMVLVTESFGGPLALRIGAGRRHPIQAIVLSATFVHQPIGSFLGRVGTALIPILFRTAPPKWVVRRFLAAELGDPSLCQRALEAIRSVSLNVFRQRLLQALSCDERAALRQCPCPLLYLQGEQDRLIPPGNLREMLRLRPTLNHAQLNTPHVLFLAAPHEAWDLMRSFFQRHSTAPKLESLRNV